MSPAQQAEHVELLLHELDVGGRIEPGLGEGGEDLVLVAEAPVADLLAGEVGRRGDAGVLERHLQRARALEDLGDVDDVGALLAGLQRLGHPGDGEVGLAVGQHLLRHDVDAALEDRRRRGTGPRRSPGRSAAK